MIARPCSEVLAAASYSLSVDVEQCNRQAKPRQFVEPANTFKRIDENAVFRIPLST